MNALNYLITCLLPPPPALPQRHHRPHPSRWTHRVIKEPCGDNWSRVPFFIGDEKLPSLSCLRKKNTNKVAQKK